MCVYRVRPSLHANLEDPLETRLPEKAYLTPGPRGDSVSSHYAEHDNGAIGD